MAIVKIQKDKLEKMKALFHNERKAFYNEVNQIRQELDKEKQDWRKQKIEEHQQMQRVVDIEKEKWENYKNKIQQINALKDDIVELNVSGVTDGFTVTRSLMKSFPGSYLDAMFSGNFPLQRTNGKIFINRDPVIFRLIIQYLRNNIHPMKLDEQTREQYEIELEFMGLISKKSQVELDLENIFKNHPDIFEDK